MTNFSIYYAFLQILTWCKNVNKDTPSTRDVDNDLGYTKGDWGL